MNGLRCNVNASSSLKLPFFRAVVNDARPSIKEIDDLVPGVGRDDWLTKAEEE